MSGGGASCATIHITPEGISEFADTVHILHRTLANAVIGRKKAGSAPLSVSSLSELIEAFHESLLQYCQNRSVSGAEVIYSPSQRLLAQYGSAATRHMFKHICSVLEVAALVEVYTYMLYIYIYICVYVSVCMSVCVYVYIHLYMCVCMHILLPHYLLIGLHSNVSLSLSLLSLSLSLLFLSVYVCIVCRWLVL